MNNTYVAPELDFTVLSSEDILSDSPQNELILDGSILY